MNGFWFFMLCMDLLLPIVMILFGLGFQKNPPKEINAAFGYRTAMSMKNKDTWTFAQIYFAKIWYKWGMIMLPASIIIMLPTAGKNDDIVGGWGGIICFLQLVPLIGSIFATEKALKRVFDRDGKRNSDAVS